jgi:hypothetical protein
MWAPHREHLKKIEPLTIFSGYATNSDMLATSDYFMGIEYIEKATLILIGALRIFQQLLDLFMSKISARNSVILFYVKYLESG